MTSITTYCFLVHVYIKVLKKRLRVRFSVNQGAVTITERITYLKMSQQVSVFGGFGGLILIFCLILCACCFCYILRVWRKRCGQHNGQEQPRRSNSMVYSVTMQGGNSSSFYNAVTEYLRNSQTDQSDIDLTVRQRQLNGNVIDGKMITPQGLPSYDDVISGKLEGHVEPPPPYSQEANCNLDVTSNQS